MVFQDCLPLTCSTAHQEACLARSQGPSRNLRDLSSIMMKLMQGHVKENGAVGVDNTNLWPLSSDAVTFLSEITSATTATELLNVGLYSL